MRSGSPRSRWQHRTTQFLATIALAAMAQIACAESDYAAAWGPSVGAQAPMLSANDQDGNLQDIDSLKGTNGLLFVFNRSVDW